MNKEVEELTRVLKIIHGEPVILEVVTPGCADTSDKMSNYARIYNNSHIFYNMYTHTIYRQLNYNWKN